MRNANVKSNGHLHTSPFGAHLFYTLFLKTSFISKKISPTNEILLLSMQDLNYSLVKHFTKPEPGEFVPIEFIEMTREIVAWSPKLKQSIYVTPDMPDAGELERVREVNVLTVVNQLSGSISTIELTDEEKDQFENVHKVYQEKGGQILFSRKKVGRKTVSFFELLEEKEEKYLKKEIEVKSMLLSEKLEGE
jgi:hypothetical protein